MGLREKVALLLAVITLMEITVISCSLRENNPNKGNFNERKQIRNVNKVTHPSFKVTVRPHIQDEKSESKTIDKNHEAIYKTFNFPDVEYPTASTPRLPFYLQESNILQRSPVQRGAEYPSSTTVQYPLSNHRRNGKFKYSPKQLLKTTKSPVITTRAAEVSTTPKPNSAKNDGAFSDFEHPHSAKNTRRSNSSKHNPNKQPNYDVNNNVLSTSTTESNKNNFIYIDFSTSKPTTQKAVLKSNNLYDQYVTPAPAVSESTKTTTPFILTPYTTLYFDTTPSYIHSNTTKEENCTHVDPKKFRRKKKAKKKNAKNDSSTTSTAEIAQIADKILNLRTSENYEDMSLFCATTPIPNERLFTTKPKSIDVIQNEHISSISLNQLDTRSAISNDTLSSVNVMTTTPPYLTFDINTVNTTPIHSSDNAPTNSYDRKVTSISDVIYKIVAENRHNKDSSCCEDSIINNNKSLTCGDNENSSPLSSRENVYGLPAIDEEFTTDVLPDFDESMPSFTISTSTLSPLTFETVDEVWASSHVIDPYRFMSYTDELEEYYIAVP